MLHRKIESHITKYLTHNENKVLIVSGARQVGKSFIIRHVANKLFPNFIELNLIKDYEGERLFEKVRTTDDFYLTLSMIAGDKLGTVEDTIIFLDEIQQYPHLLTMMKFLREENRFRYVASGSLLGVTLKKSTSIPLGSIDIMQMYPMDFEEFLIANGFGNDAIEFMRSQFIKRESLSESMHSRVMDLFKRYLLVGGMPEAVNTFLTTHNIVKIRDIQRDIHDLYSIDASKYDDEHRLKISRIYNLVPSNLENKKKRLIFKNIENIKGKRAENYHDEIEYLISSGITLEVKAISNPTFPLLESEHKNLLKLYLNDVGLLTAILYRNNISAILNDEASINLGSVYECAVATELASSRHNLFYYDNRTHGEVDYLIDDYSSLSVVPIEVKSGKDYKRHSALTRFVSTEDYHINYGYVLSNNREVECDGKITYMPVYYVMFMNGDGHEGDEILI